MTKHDKFKYFKQAVTLLIIFNIFFISCNIYFFTINENLLDIYFEPVIQKNKQQNITKTVSQYCMNYKNNMTRVDCVAHFVKKSGYYDFKITNATINDAETLMKEGGDCKSWTAFYAAIFENMGFEVSLESPPQHVFVRVSGDNFYCNVDQRMTTCYKTINGTNRKIIV